MLIRKFFYLIHNIMKKITLKGTLVFILKFWPLLVVALCTAVFLIFPHKPVGPLLSGMAAIGFMWVCFYSWRRYMVEKPAKPATLPDKAAEEPINE
jgi:type VI protein secretion system component VasK